MTPKVLLPFALMLASTMARAEEPCWLVEQGELVAVSKEQARDASQGAVVLHFGETFNDVLRDGLIGAAHNLGYRRCAFLGGPDGSMSLFIDGQEGKRDFSEDDALQYLIIVMEKNAQHLRGLD